MNTISFEPDGWADYLFWQQEDKKTIKLINKLLQDVSRNGNMGIGKPEALKGEFAGYWSRRIDDKNRLVYRIKDGRIEVVACRGHYGDK